MGKPVGRLLKMLVAGSFLAWAWPLDDLGTLGAVLFVGWVRSGEEQGVSHWGSNTYVIEVVMSSS